MKFQIAGFSIVLVLLVSFLFAGCTTNPVAYNYADSELNSATILFQSGNPGVRFISLNGVSLPKPASGTRWEPIKFPSGTALTIIVHANYEVQTRTRVSGLGLVGDIVNIAGAVNEIGRGVDAQVAFNCPGLEAGKLYSLAFVKESGIPGKNRLILTDLETSRIVYEQEFGLILGGSSAR